MKTPAGEREASPLARAQRENRERRRRQDQDRLERNDKVIEGLRKQQGGRTA